MIVAQNRTSNNREICIRTHEIVRELRHKIQKLPKGRTLNLHRCMLCIEHDTVLVVVYIWRILEEPVTLVDGHRNNTVILSCRMIHTACISLIGIAELALRICTLLCIFRCGDCLRILLRLGQIDGHIQSSILGLGSPLLILFDALSSDIVAVTAQFVEVIRCSLSGSIVV